MLAFLNEPEKSHALDRQSFHAYTKNTLTNRERLFEELDVINRNGFALDLEEHEPGIICLAVPVWADRRVIAGLSVTSTIWLHDSQSPLSFKPTLESVAKEIGIAAELWQFPASN